MAEFRQFSGFDDVLDQFFAEMIVRVRLAREDKLHRAQRIVDQQFQALFIAEQQRRAFVGGEAPREPNRQRVRVQDFVGGCDLRLRRAARLKLIAELLAGKRRQAFAAAFVRAPQFRVGDAIHFPPDFRAIRVGRATPGRGSGHTAPPFRC